jgi:tetratricopeptide (TPR) repeat protein
MRTDYDLIRAGAAAALLALVLPACVHAQIPAPHALTSKRAQNAAPAIDDATRESPSFAALQQQLSAALAAAAWDDALAIAVRQREAFPNEMKATADLASVYLRRGEVARAEPLLKLALTQRSEEFDGELAPIRGEINSSLGSLALSRGKADEAIAFLLRAIDDAPTAARTRYMLAAAWSAKGDVERSDRELHAAFDLDPSAAGPRDYVAMGGALARADEAEKAVELLRSGVKLFPFDVAVRVAYADALLAAKQPAPALNELLYSRMIMHEGAPETSGIAERLKRLRDETERSREEPSPEVEAIFAYLDDASTEQHEQALVSIHEAVRLDKGASVVPSLLLAQTYKATGRYGEAERLLTKIVGSDPRCVPALTILADIYFAQGRNERARAIVEQATRVDAQNPKLRSVVSAWQLVSTEKVTSTP